MLQCRPVKSPANSPKLPANKPKARPSGKSSERKSPGEEAASALKSKHDVMKRQQKELSVEEVFLNGEPVAC